MKKGPTAPKREGRAPGGALYEKRQKKGEKKSQKGQRGGERFALWTGGEDETTGGTEDRVKRRGVATIQHKKKKKSRGKEIGTCALGQRG